MTINYKGYDKDFEYRLAEINFDEENKKESKLAKRLVFFLENVKGYSIDHPVEGYMTCEVENMDEYKEFKKDYKGERGKCVFYGNVNIKQ